MTPEEEKELTEHLEAIASLIFKNRAGNDSLFCLLSQSNLAAITLFTKQIPGTKPAFLTKKAIALQNGKTRV